VTPDVVNVEKMAFAVLVSAGRRGLVTWPLVLHVIRTLARELVELT
jgi:hypothetical protein